MAKRGYSHALTKTGPGPAIQRTGIEDYEHHERAEKLYTQFISGYTEQELAKFHGLKVNEVERDILHIRSFLAPRVIIAQENDRNKILLQRSEGEKYRTLLGDALSKDTDEYLAARVSPVGPLREYREAVGMTEKPGGISVNVAQNTVNVSNPSGVGSSEDILRRVLSRMSENQEQRIIEAEIEDQNESNVVLEDIQEYDTEIPDMED